MASLKLISFDLQGTISDSAFSDEFWLELLPLFYAEKHQLSLEQAKKSLEMDFQSIGKYHALFYNHRLRLDALLSHWEFKDIVSQLKSKPVLDEGVINIIKKIPHHIPNILFSATTYDFINIELGDAKKYFVQLFSSIDDFNTPGKPPMLFRRIAHQLNMKPQDCLHIGDCREMDYENATQAGWQSYHFHKNQERHLRLPKLEETIMNFLRI